MWRPSRKLVKHVLQECYDAFLIKSIYSLSTCISVFLFISHWSQFHSSKLVFCLSASLLFSCRFTEPNCLYIWTHNRKDTNNLEMFTLSPHTYVYSVLVIIRYRWWDIYVKISNIPRIYYQLMFHFFLLCFYYRI